MRTVDHTLLYLTNFASLYQLHDLGACSIAENCLHFSVDVCGSWATVGTNTSYLLYRDLPCSSGLQWLDAGSLVHIDFGFGIFGTPPSMTKIIRFAEVSFLDLPHNSSGK